jgi:hypothetical protein
MRQSMERHDRIDPLTISHLSVNVLDEGSQIKGRNEKMSEVRMVGVSRSLNALCF